MGKVRLVSILVLAVGLLAGCGDGQNKPEARPGDSPESIDLRSYRLGGIGAFAEMVGAGVKTLALSSPMTPTEIDALLADAQRIATENGAEIFRETEFLVTDLFSSDLTNGLEVLLIYNGDTLDRYQDLKADKLRLVESGGYEGKRAWRSPAGSEPCSATRIPESRNSSRMVWADPEGPENREPSRARDPD